MLMYDVYRPRCHRSSLCQHPHPLAASMPMPTKSAVSVVLLNISFRLLLRYFCLAALASVSVDEVSPALWPPFLPFRYSFENLRSSSYAKEGVRSGLIVPSSPAPRTSRNPLCGRSGGAGSAFMNPYPSSSASVPLSLGECEVFLRFVWWYSSDIVPLEGWCRLVRKKSWLDDSEAWAL